MKDIIKYFDNAINYIKGKRKNKNKEVKMVIDLGHDVTVNSIHIFMNMILLILAKRLKKIKNFGNMFIEY